MLHTLIFQINESNPKGEQSGVYRNSSCHGQLFSYPPSQFAGWYEKNKLTQQHRTEIQHNKFINITYLSSLIMNHPQVEQVIQKADEFLAAYPTLCQYGACRLFLRLEIDRLRRCNGYFFSYTTLS